jgi:competence protein ComEC
MEVSFINVGYGDSILIENYAGNKKFAALIDGGVAEESHYKSSPYRIKAIDYLKERNIEKLDLVVVTHLHEDHVAGLLEVVKNIEVEQLWSNYIFPITFINKSLEAGPDYEEGELRLLNSLNIFTEICQLLLSRGKTLKQVDKPIFNLELAPFLSTDVFVPREKVLLTLRELVQGIYNSTDKSEARSCLQRLNNIVNNTSLVLRVLYKDKKILLGADAYSTYWKDILENSISIEGDILKLPHHGHPDGISKEFLKAVNPSYIVVSVSNSRTDNCPNPKVFEVIRNYCVETNKDIQILFTDAVKMQGVSTPHSGHRAVVFQLNRDISLKYY